MQVGHGSRGDVTILPTLVINDVQYRGMLYLIKCYYLEIQDLRRYDLIFICRPAGKLERSAVLRAICAGFKETTEPSICLNSGLTSDPYVFGYYCHILTSQFEK